MKDTSAALTTITFYEAPNWTSKEIATSTEIKNRVQEIFHSKKSVSEKAIITYEEVKNMPDGAILSFNNTIYEDLYLKSNNKWIKYERVNYESKIKI